MEDIKLDDLLAIWEADAKPEYINIGDTAVEISKLHAKYAKIHAHHSLRLAKKKTELAVLKKDKWFWLAGIMPRERLVELGWEPYETSLKGKVTKSQYFELIEGDTDVAQLNFIISYHEEIVNACKSILYHLKDRTTNYRTALEHLKYIQGG